MEIVFYSSLVFLAYATFGYPVTLFVASKFFTRPVGKSHITPPPLVSVVIAARDEEENISRRIKNLSSMDYPKESLQVIIISDGSSDSTGEVATSVLSSGALESPFHEASRVISYDENRGKPHALNIGVKHALGEFILFTDVRQQFKTDAVRELIANFSDPEVGCVSGELVFTDSPNSRIEGEMNFYWRLEKLVRKLESSVGSVAGATGAIYVIRKSLFKPLPEEVLLDDVMIPMNVVLQGYRTVFDAEAVAYDRVSTVPDQEKKRKIRTLMGNWQLLFLLPSLLSPARNPMFFRYLSHKVFRLFIPFFTLTLVLSSALISGAFYKTVLSLTALVFMLSLLNRMVSGIPVLNKLGKFSNTFVMLNYFNLLAFYHFLSSSDKKVW